MSRDARLAAHGAVSTSLALCGDRGLRELVDAGTPIGEHDWLSVRMGRGEETAERACALVDGELRAGISFMNAGGLLHFDAHFQNILTDGRRLFFTDFGLALSSRFELAADEAEFFEQHRTYDPCYAVTHLVNWLAVALLGHGPEERGAFVRACAEGVRPRGMPAAIGALVARYAPVADVMGGFSRRFREESRAVAYPSEALRRVGQPLFSSSTPGE
ncbi:hypothetical protein ACPCAG_15780 [Streptomyces pseudogriseolus]